MGQNPNRTNDVDTDQRRRTLNSAGAMPLTDPFIEGSQMQMMSTGLRLGYDTESVAFFFRGASS
jgi:hypothetical protein